MTDVLLPPPPAPAPPPETRGDQRHPGLDRRRAIPALLAAGLAFDAVVWSGPPTVAGAVAAVVVALAVVLAGRTTTAAARVLAGGAVAVAVWLPLRTSPWLVPVDVVAAVGLLTVAATYGRGGRLRDLTFAGVQRRGVAAPLRLHQGPGVLVRMVTAGWHRRPELAEGTGPAIARGLVLAMPLIAALAVLLASADAVFASFFQIPFSPGTSIVHVGAVAVGVFLVLPLLIEASEGEQEEPAPSTRVGTVETAVVLTGVVVLYAAFAAAQVVAALGGADHVLDTTGLTYAEYARTGFFQLLAVAGLTLLLLLALRGNVRGRRLIALAEATVVLTLVIVGVAVRRLDLYDDVFGLTMLRLSSTVAVWWIGAVFVLVGVALAGFRRRHDWLAGAALVLTVLTIVGYNAADPEALVVRHNVARDADEVPVDYGYLAGLSDDAVPALEDALDDLDADTAAATIGAICELTRTDPDTGFLAWNRSTARADDVRDRLGC